MLLPWLDRPGARELLERWSQLTGLDLIRLGTTASAEEIRDTAVTQPLIVAAGLLAARELAFEDEVGSVVVAGHSIGEVTAAALARVISDDDAVALAARRGAEMAAACAEQPTSMAAVLGGDADAVVAAIAAAGLTAANRNGKGQIVAAGSAEGIAALTANPPAGARVRPLEVAGAFHTVYMARAQSGLASFVADLKVSDPRFLLLSNADGRSISDGHEVIDRLVAQVTAPVRWDLCQQTLADLKVSAVIELPPAGVLTGLAKRELPGVELLAVKTPDHLDAAQRLLHRADFNAQGGHTPDFRVVTSPVKGVFTRATGVDEGHAVQAGTAIGSIATNSEQVDLVAGSAGILTEWLRHDGDIVAAGLPVARLESALHTPETEA